MVVLKVDKWLSLVEQLIQSKSVEERLERVEAFIHGAPFKFVLITKPIEILVLKALIALDQEATLLQGVDGTEEEFIPFVKSLVAVEEFYKEIGGLVGYYVKVLELYLETKSEECAYFKPSGLDISKECPRHLIKEALLSLDRIGALYPVGGAGDRLDFRDEETGACQSVAMYPFMGRSLLEALVRDVRGLEYLAEKLTGRPHKIPLMFMTSLEKQNHEQVVKCLTLHNFFGKSPQDFLVASQPLVPVIDEEGHFVLTAPLKLFLKPGGHGAIWKVALQHKAFEWFEKRGVSYFFLRQINNPIGGVDKHLIALLGQGIFEQKAFGFSVCERRVKSHEGMVARIEMGKVEWIGNIEYTDFKKRGIQDEPEKSSSSYSAFPANTNILFANLKSVKEAALANPHPGLLLNPKLEVSQGVMGGRLESAMQHIGDIFTVPLNQKECPTFVMFNKRHKTISPIKRGFTESILETPFAALYDTLQLARELFKEKLLVDLPKLPEEGHFCEGVAPFMITYHPALGPLYDVIAQKIQRGHISFGSELVLEIAELEMRDFDLKGSFIVEAEELTGRCYMNHCKIVNRGVSSMGVQEVARGEVNRLESLHIKILGNGEFFAENVVFEGTFEIVVKENTCVRAKMRDGKVVFVEEKLQISPWVYSFNELDEIVLKKGKLI